jgi:aldose 1-epimerase
MRVDLELTTLDRPFPATVGWHPWFRRTIGGAQATLRVEAASMYERGPDHLPTGRLIEPSRGPWDDAFTGMRAPVGITWGDQLRLTVESDLDHVVVYDEPAEALCVEPQSGPPDAFALGRAVVVAPGQPLTATMRWLWQVPGDDL